MSRTIMIRLFLDILIIIFLLGFILSLRWYTTGSLETMPAEEQQEKAQIAAMLAMIMNGVLCVICAAVRRWAE